MPDENQPPNHLFKLVIVVSAAFVLTILLMIVTAFASLENPLVRFFDVHGLKLIGVEVVLILGSSAAAMWLDGKQSDSAQKTESGSGAQAKSSPDDATSVDR